MNRGAPSCSFAAIVLCVCVCVLSPARLTETKRGPVFDPHLVRQMIKVANSFNNSRGVSFEQFVEILAPAKGEKQIQRRNSLEL